MTIEETKKVAIDALEDLKALDIMAIDVLGRSSFTDMMIIATGTSNRHVKSLADNVQRMARENGLDVIGVEGGEEAEWVLVDLADVIVHVMLKTVRDFYNLEKLWSDGPVMPLSQVTAAPNK